MASGMNWKRVHYEKKIWEQGSAPVEDPRPARKSKSVKTLKSNTSSSKSRSRKKNRTPIERRDATRRHYILEIKKAIAENKTPPSPFKKLDPEVKREIAAIGPVSWAQRQPEFETIQTKKMRSAAALERKNLNNSAQIHADIEKIESKIKDLKRQYVVLKSELKKKQQELKSIG